MITLPERPEVRIAFAQIIAEVCRCEEQPLLDGKDFQDVIEQYDSLAMLEILLGIEAKFEITTDDMLPSDYRSQDEMAEIFPKNLDALVDHAYEIVAKLNLAEQQKALQAEQQVQPSAEEAPASSPVEHTEAANQQPPSPKE